MATFSGDVQYSQNGTVTNPCYKLTNNSHELNLVFIKLDMSYNS